MNVLQMQLSVERDLGMKPEHPMSPDSQESEIIQRYWSGEPTRYIAEEIGVYHEFVARVLRKAGGEVPRHPMSADTYRKARAFFESGETANQIAKKSGAKLEAVYALFPTAPRVKDKFDRDAIVAAVEDGWPQIELVRTFGVEPKWLRTHFPEVNWMKRRTNGSWHKKMEAKIWS